MPPAVSHPALQTLGSRKTSSRPGPDPRTTSGTQQPFETNSFSKSHTGGEPYKTIARSSRCFSGRARNTGSQLSPSTLNGRTAPHSTKGHSDSGLSGFHRSRGQDSNLGLVAHEVSLPAATASHLPPPSPEFWTQELSHAIPGAPQANQVSQRDRFKSSRSPSPSQAELMPCPRLGSCEVWGHRQSGGAGRNSALQAPWPLPPRAPLLNSVVHTRTLRFREVQGTL